MNSSLCDTLWLSEKRKNLLLLLIEGPREISQIKTSLNVTSKAMMPQIKLLKKQQLIVQNGEFYELSEIGRPIVENMIPLLNTLEVIEENKDYWANRDMSVIPSSLLKRIGELGDCMLIEPDLNHLFELPRQFTENLEKSRCIMTFISYYHPLYLPLYCRLAKTRAEMSIVFTGSVLERLKEEFQVEFKILMDSKNIEMGVCKENKQLPTVTVTDRFMYLCLLDKQGKYDHRKIMSFDKSALMWGKELFIHYSNLSQKIT